MPSSQSQNKKGVVPMDKLLNSIREAEKKAKAIVEDSQKKGDKAVSDAMERAKQMVKRAESHAPSEIEARLEERKKGLAKAISQIGEEGKKELAKLAKSAQAGTDQAVALILKKFEEEVKNA
ncbi:MAG: V-type H+-transporting ATPase subunit E [archaeon GW2011_AR3]|nr:MAG: V-type H+-transporting ATPase subunit E [archaeon GW2011_AR3]